MARELIPITPAVVKWARERAGLNLDDAARRFPKIAAWESGDGMPTYGQVEDMASAFKVPIAVFFFPAPPSVPAIEESFRTLPEIEFDHLPSRIRLLLRKAKAFQISLAELHAGRNPAERPITRELHFSVNVPAHKMAASVRDFLGVTTEEQRSWTGMDDALEQWRLRFIESGIYVFKDQFRTNGFAGFCLTDPEFPIVYVNNTASKSRQIFTLFHELAHLLFQTSGIDIDDDRLTRELAGDAKRIEVLCNRFAGTILVPEGALTAALKKFETVDDRSVALLAEDFHVSRLVIYRRLLDSGRIDQETYDAAHRRSVEPPVAKRESGGDYYNTKLAYLGRPFVGLALSQYRQHRISTEQAAEYLDIKPKNLAALEERFLRGVAA